ncbi:MAG: hypothetical protein BWY10_02629 [Chloroflexi bacterium ADurb.Bin180]|nr:MAG: hypothetical protein BWY10_02629 [Chloroflexi bacterium ADurb.Bin180]
MEIGGRKFQQIEDWTVEQDWWLMQRIRAAGLDSIGVRSERPDDIAISISEAIEAKLAESGLTVDLLGGLLVPEGMSPDAWTPAMAEETAAFLKRQRGREAREAVRNLAVWALVHFFANGLVSFKISPTPSSVSDGPQTQVDEQVRTTGEEAGA